MKVKESLHMCRSKYADNFILFVPYALYNQSATLKKITVFCFDIQILILH